MNPLSIIWSGVTLTIQKARRYVRSNQDRCGLVPFYDSLSIQHRNGVNCDLIAKNDEKEITLSLLKRYLLGTLSFCGNFLFRLGFKGQKIGISSSWQDLALKAFISKQGCEAFKTSRQYLTVSPHPEEDNYPIAYSIVVHRGSGQEMTQM